jgi:hypothetical protein
LKPISPKPPASELEIELENLVPTAAHSGTIHSSHLPGCWVGMCIDEQHPHLQGRIKIRVSMPSTPEELWVPCLVGLSVREGDRVLLQQAQNHSELIVVGVVDGYKRRPEIPLVPAASIQLKPDEMIHVVSQDQQSVVQVFSSDDGVTVRLGQSNIELELPGKLRMKAHQIELIASQGNVDIEASQDVNVQGEMIHLN